MPVDTSDEEIEIENNTNKNIVTNPLSEYCNAFTEQDHLVENQNINNNNKLTKSKSKSTENTDNYCEIYDDIVTDQRQDISSFQTNNAIYSSKKELDQKPSIANYSNTEVRVSSSSSADQIGKQKMTTTNLNYSKTNNSFNIKNGSINEYENPLDLLPPNSPDAEAVVNSDGDQSNKDNEQIKVKKHTITSTLGSLNDASQSSREGNYSSQGFHEIMAEEYCQVSDGNFQNNQDI